jgi:hypothetical protein
MPSCAIGRFSFARRAGISASALRSSRRISASDLRWLWPGLDSGAPATKARLNPASRYAIVGVFAACAADGHPAIAVTGARRHGAFRWREAEAARAMASSLNASATCGCRRRLGGGPVCRHSLSRPSRGGPGPQGRRSGRQLRRPSVVAWRPDRRPSRNDPSGVTCMRRADHCGLCVES